MLVSSGQGRFRDDKAVVGVAVGTVEGSGYLDSVEELAFDKNHVKLVPVR